MNFEVSWQEPHAHMRVGLDFRVEPKLTPNHPAGEPAAS